MLKNTFIKQYCKWQEKCIQELKQQGYNVTDDNVEIYESGIVYFIDSNIKEKLVTAWRDSEFYTK